MRLYNFNNSSGKVVKALIVINVSVFILVHLLPKFNWLFIFGMVPGYVFSRFRLWQLATYMFLHVGLFHLVINMLMLWWFGVAIESTWGKREFLVYYFFTGIGAGLCSFLTSLGSYSPVIGASGAIFGLLVAYAVMFPETVILLFFIFPLKIRHAVFVLALINLLAALSAQGGGIAYFAHLGGGLFGYIYLKNETIRRKIFYLGLVKPLGGLKKKQSQRRKLQEKGLNDEADLILDKISKYGMDSLSSQERKVLEKKANKDKNTQT